MKDFKLNEAKSDVEKLLKYVPWLEAKQGEIVSRIYSDNDLSKTTVTFPVYDATLLSFVNEARDTKLMDTNYHYVYSDKFIKSYSDELKVIEAATVKTSGDVCAILSRYVLKGMTKGSVWQEGITYGIYLAALLKLKKLLEIWDAPLA
ncbi:MAG: hypothetical protein MJ123_10315 [Lachnospiraceae bacterium]|nr:hypothetical protein [Lachnospiraceae bacterium]